MSNRPIQEEQQHKRRDRRRVVSFHPKTRVLEIPTVEELSVREIQSLWPTPEESKKNQGELVTCVRMARKNPRDASVCTRGIEKLLDPASVARLRKCREDLIDAVLDNQEAQWQRGLHHADPEEIRSIATRISQQSVEEAITLAAKDEAYVRTTRRREQADRVGRVVAPSPTVSPAPPSSTSSIRRRSVEANDSDDEASKGERSIAEKSIARRQSSARRRTIQCQA